MITDTAALTINAAIEQADDADADAAYAEHLVNQVGGLFARANAANANRAAANAYQHAANTAYAVGDYAAGNAVQYKIAIANRTANRFDA